jgi:hypothetical protein
MLLLPCVLAAAQGAPAAGEPALAGLDLLAVGGCGFTRLVEADKDGILDLAVFLGGIDKRRVFLGAGNGSCRPPPLVLAGRHLLRDENHFATADFNLDGRQAFVVTGQAGSIIGGTSSTTIVVHVGGPGGAYAGPQGFSIGQFARLGGLATGDLDGDGRADIVVAHVLKGRVRTLLAGTAPFLSPGLGQPLPQQAPVLSAGGATTPGAAVQLDLSAVPPGSSGLLLVDLSTSVQPALGLSVALPQGAALPVSGNQTWHAVWPAGLVPGMAVSVQARPQGHRSAEPPVAEAMAGSPPATWLLSPGGAARGPRVGRRMVLPHCGNA